MTSKVVYKIVSKTGTVVFSQATDFWVSSIKGLSAEAVMATTQYANQIGTTTNSISIPSRKITLNGTISGNIELRRRQLQDVMPPGETVTFYIIDGKEEWYIVGEVSHAPDFSDGEVLQEYQFSLHCNYPYFKQRNISYQLAGLTPLFKTPFFTGGNWTVSEFTKNMFKQIPNNGNLQMSFRLIFYARAKVIKPALYNAEKNSYIKTSITLSAGESLTISTIATDKEKGKAAVYQTAEGEIKNGYRFLMPGSDLAMTIAPGGNTLIAAAAEFLENLNCTIVSAGGERHSL